MYLIRRDDGAVYLGTTDTQPIFSVSGGRPALFGAEAVEIRLSGLRKMGHKVERVEATSDG